VRWLLLPPAAGKPAAAAARAKQSQCASPEPRRDSGKSADRQNNYPEKRQAKQ
jgi:hypothetical protein